MLCPRCRNHVRSFAFSTEILCDTCGARWIDFEPYVEECKGADTPRMVWVHDGKHTYLRLLHKWDLKQDEVGRFVIIEDKRCLWWPL